MFFGSAIKELKATIAGDKNRLNELTQLHAENWAQLVEQRERFETAARDSYDDILSENIRHSEQLLHRQIPYNIPGWDIENWSSWEHREPDLSSDLFFGTMAERSPVVQTTLRIATLIDFFGNQQCYFVRSKRNEANTVNGFFQSIALRLYARLGNKVQFTFIDPSGFGKAFPIAKQLPTRLDSGDLFRLLEDVSKDITRINQTYGLSDDKMFDSIADAILINEKFEIIFVANFPKDYDRRVIERLLKIADQGPIAGKYVFIHQNMDEEVPRDIDLDSVSSAAMIYCDESDFRWPLKSGQSVSMSWKLDEKPSEDITTYIVKKIKDSIGPEPAVFDCDATATPKNWRESAIESIEVNIGLSGNKSPLNIWFGRKASEGSRQCVHGILAGMPGSGKSNLYHALILGLASKYSPKEVALYLIDGKDGVEFQDYKKLPHAEFVSLKSLPSLSRSILKDLTEEIERRNELFKEQYQVDNYENFRKKTDKVHELPRILLIVDEYQELFEGDNLGEASNYLRRLSEEGRSAGIHMLLGSQRFGTVNMMHQSAIFGNIHMRIAMKLSLADRQSLTEFGKEGKDFLANCDVPGKVVVNDQSGDDGYNKIGKVALIKKEDRLKAITEIIETAEAAGIPQTLLTTNIFNGVEQPFLNDNPQFNYLLKHDKKISRQELENFARKEVYNGGLGESGWFSGETPFVFWVGQEFNVRGHANIVTRRRQRENVLVIGDNNDARYGMLFGMLSSAVLNACNKQVEFYIADKSIPGTPWSAILSQVSREIFEIKQYTQQYASKNSEVLSIINSLYTKIAERKNIAEEDRHELPSIIFFAADLDRIGELNLQLNKFGSLEETEAGKQLRQIIIEGPALGIHLFLSFEGMMPLYNVISKKNLEFFRHRIALQMSEQDAFDLVRRRDASRLQNHGARPIAGFYLDIGSNKTSTFKPYIVSKGISDDLINEIVKSQS